MAGFAQERPLGASRTGRSEQTMAPSFRRRSLIGAAMAACVAASAIIGGAAAKDVKGRTELGVVPEFHPELGLGALQGYLDPKALPDSLALIPPPPQPGSEAFAHDQEVARSTFGLRDTPRYALAASDFDLRLSKLADDFSCALDAQITQASAPYLSTLLRRSFSDLALSTYKAKDYYRRKRPFQVDQGPMGVPDYRAQLEKDPSYPSGHTAIGWGFALILSELAPDRADAVLARGRAYGESRMVVNHHWYSDVVWGRVVGAATVARLHADPTFRADMDAARDELAAVRAGGGPPKGDCAREAEAMAMGYQASDVTAIDVLLEPDATMLQRSAAINARLRTLFPQGFALDATHNPHITLIQRFVRTDDLDKVYAALNRVFASADVAAMKLEAYKSYYLPMDGLGVAGIVARPTPELVRLQADVIAAVAPFTVETGDSAAFVTTPDDPVIDPALIDYVSTFVPKGSGERFNPHVTTGVAPTSALDPMIAEPFEAFAFSPVGAAVYQLGQFGTAAKKLKELDAKP